MDDIRIHLLEDSKDKLVRDLQVNVILTPLYERKVITSVEFENINAENGDREKARYLVDILKQKDNDAYDIFCEVLKKDYDWLARGLLYHNNDTKRLNTIEDRIYDDTLTKANIPRKPPHYVVRTRKLNELKSLLRNVKRGEYVTLHGMPLIGKSCLAMAAIHDRELLKNSFKNRVFWINVGDKPTENDLIMHLLRLYQSVSLADSSNVTNRNQTNRTVSNRQSINVTDDLEMIRYRLRMEFTEDSLREALLILDDVHSLKVIEAFNLGCKTLVTTRDKNVVPKSGNHFLELKEGFTDDETLKLFADCLEVEVDKLPPQARKFNKVCKGGPMLIALIGSLLEEYKEDAKHNPRRWDDYLQKLQKYDLGNSADIQLSKTITMCIENLDKKLQDYYKTLVLFLEDVNIMPATLQTIWSLGKYKVEEIMTTLNQKSLVVSSYNQQLKTYVYGVHDLFLHYLRLKLGDEKIKELHRDLISKYREKCDNQFANLPNDNYIFSYIGYHLYKAELWDDFPRIYFDLNFISAKIKAVGPTDLLTDFKRYREQITNNGDPHLETKLEEYEQFVQDCGQDLRKFPKLDIVQCALNQSKNTSVYKQAREIANSRPDYLYFQLLCEQQAACKQKTIDFQESISVACFTKNLSNILVGYKSGKIDVWDLNYRNHIHVFYGHKQCITNLIIHPNNSHQFLSISKDGLVKLWSLDGVITTVTNGHDSTDDNELNHPTTPRVKQPYWVNMGFDGTADMKDNSLFTYKSNDPILCASFSHSGKYILTGTSTGDMFIWETATGKVLNELEKIVITGISCCRFSLDDTLVFCSSESSILIYAANGGKQLASFKNDREILTMYTIPDDEYNKILTISEDLLTVWYWQYEQLDEKLDGNAEITLTMFKQEKFKISGKIYISGTVTSDGNYVALADQSNDHSNKVQIWNLEKRHAVQEMLHCNGKIIGLDTHMSDDHSIHLLITTSDSVKYWILYPEDLIKLKRNKLRELFAVNYKNSNIPKLAVVDVKNNVYIYNGLREQTKIPAFDVKLQVTYLTYTKSKIAIGYENGSVSEYMENGQFPFPLVQSKIMSIPDEKIVYLEYLNDCTLVAAGDEGSLMIRDKNINKKLIDGKSTLSKKDYRAPIIKCYLWHDSKRFISITQDSKIKSWALQNGSDGSNLENVLFVPYDDKNVVTMAALTQLQDKIAFTLESGGFHIYNLKETPEEGLKVSINQIQQNLEDKSNSKSCCFSSDGKILAVGQESGKIILWDIARKNCLTTLDLHRSSVRNLHFSPSIFPMIMISVGEQIAWWDVGYITQQRGLEQNGRSAVIDEIWENKIGKKQLLATLKPRGTHTTHVQASSDFTSFTMVDDFGLIYIMDIYRPNHFRNIWRCT